MVKADVHFLNIVSREIQAEEQLMGHSKASGTLPAHKALVFLLDFIN